MTKAKMYKLSLLILVCNVLYSKCSVNELSNNFFANLQANPKLLEKGFTLDTKQFIDQQITNYVQLITHKTTKRKRSLTDSLLNDLSGSFRIGEVEGEGPLPGRFPEDVKLFENEGNVFGIALEREQIRENTSTLVIFDLDNSKFDKIVQVPLENGNKIVIFNDTNNTLIAVSQSVTGNTFFTKKPSIYRFSNKTLTRLQTLDENPTFDIAFWSINDETHLGVATAGKVAIFKQLFKHFDLIQELQVEEVSKLEPFRIRSHHYLAIANTNPEDKKQFTNIYKFNHQTEQYQLYQKIQTKTGKEVHFFTFQNNNQATDYFLIVTTSKTNSILYKFIDDYFIPFQNLQVEDVKEWLAFNKNQHQVVLFALTDFDGVKTFEYDGWVFQPSLIESPTFAAKGIRHIHIFNDSLLIVNKNSKGGDWNRLKINFIHTNSLNKVHDRVMNWCEINLGKFLSTETILGKVQRGDVEDAPNFTERIDLLNSRLDSITKQLEVVPNLKELTSGEVVFNKNVNFTKLEAETFNNHKTDSYLLNTIQLNASFNLSEAQFDNLLSLNFTPTMLNKRSTSELLYQNSNLELDSLKIDDSLHSQQVQIDGELNKFKFDQNKILLVEGDQNINEEVSFEQLKVDNLQTGQINNQKPSDLSSKTLEPIKINSLKNLSLKSAFLGGYINEVDVPVLDRYALKKKGDQVITKKYDFESISGLKLTGIVSGTNLSTLLPIDQNEISLRRLIFEELVEVNNLTVFRLLNTISVNANQELDVLLVNKTEKQKITGMKVFEELVIENPINLRSKIKNKQFDDFNPVVSINDELILTGDKRITGAVTVEEFLSARNLQAGSYSVSKLQESGLRLSEKEVQPHLNFVQQLEVEELFTDAINMLRVEDFVVNGGEEAQIVTGRKQFKNGVFITGDSEVHVVNGVNVGDLDREILRVEGEQVIEAKHHFKHLITEEISTGQVNIQGESQVSVEEADLTLENNLELVRLTTNRLTVNGQVNEFNFTLLVSDTVKLPCLEVITGWKHFQNLEIEQLNNLPKNLELEQMKAVLENGKIVLSANNTKIVDDLEVETLEFLQKLNGITKASFGINPSEKKVQTVSTPRTFSKLFANKAFINTINKVPIGELVSKTVKIDEEFEFNSATFSSSVTSKQAVLLNGQIERLDFDNILLSHSNQPQTISDTKQLSDVFVDGNIDCFANVNGFNLSSFCQLGQMNVVNNLIINGTAYFAKGPSVNSINSLNLDEIEQNAWFENKDSILTGSFNFSGLVFNQNVNLTGLVNGENITEINKNYISKSKDQTILTGLTFENVVTFENRVNISEILTNDEVNGVNLDEFVRTALLDDFDQVFETILYLETCQINDLKGKFTVNQLDLNTDVMRYDKINMVTGPKTFDNLNINSLKSEKSIHIQNVDILEWFKNSALTVTSCNVTAPLTVRNVNFLSGFNLNGMLNGVKINEDGVLLKDVSQVITGNKTFLTSIFDSNQFKSIKLRGVLNDVSMTQLIKNQAFKNRDNRFKTVFNLQNNISANNLILEENFQGVNMSELLQNVTKLGALNNLLASYQKLVAMAEKLDYSIKNQAYYLHHYKINQKIPLADNSRVILCPDLVKRIASVRNINGQKLEIFGFSAETKQFVSESIFDLKTQNFNYFDQILNDRYFYVEELGNGRFFNMQTNEDLILPMNQTVSVTSFIFNNANCALFVYLSEQPRIYCEKNGRIGLVQVLDELGAYQATSDLINGVPTLVVVKEPKQGIESEIVLYNPNSSSTIFEKRQSLFVAETKSVSLINYRQSTYLAIASGHLQNAMHSGRVLIEKFNENAQRFEQHQIIEMDAPLQVEFSKLPSDELVLYVLTDNPTEPLLVYRYSGIEGFRLGVVGKTLPTMKYFSIFMGGADQHFIVAQSNEEINVIEAVFKGERVE